MPSPDALDGRVHHALLRHIVDEGHAPDAAAVAQRLGMGRADVEASLRRLHEGHGLVLHPGTTDVWVIHPFALAPTPFWVERDGGGWWGNCAWCALGIAALVGGDVTISARYGGEDRPVRLHVRDGQVQEPDLLVHFSRPIARAWDNVHYYCATVQLFDDEAAVDAWCARHGIARGEVVPAGQAWPMARAWYGRHLDPDWRKWTPAQAQAIFADAGLTGPFWHVPQRGERF